MKRVSSLVFLYVLVSASLSASAQSPVPAPAPTPTQQQQQGVQPADEDSIVRITTNLVQVDAVVTDDKGRVVTNLRPEDFEVQVNGKPQKITNFSFISTEAPQPRPPVTEVRSAGTNSRPVPIPPVPIRPEQVKRTIALVVDDLNLSFESINQARKALKKFVDEQMQPGDMVAIIRVGSGVGALQQFTSDKRVLYAAIENVKYNLSAGRFRSFETEKRPEVLDAQTKLPSDATDKGVKKGGDPELFREDRLVIASLRTVDYVVRGMRELPGRKAVMLLSDGFSLFSDDDAEKSVQLRRAIQRLVDQSGRAGVVIYAMDTRGLVAEGMTPADAMYGSGSANMSSKEIMDLARNNREKFFRALDGLMYLTEQTGGFTVYNSNDLSGGIKKALDDQKSYYLIGFQPEGTTFDQTQSCFNHLAVKVKNPSLKVRYRSGFFGVKDEEITPIAKTPEQQVMRALTSPFNSDDISLRLTALFGNDAAAGSYLRSLVHISPDGITFTEKPDGTREAVINIVAVTFSDSGAVMGSVGETHTVTLTQSLYNRALQSGLVYSLNVPLKRAGAYQLRVAVRDDKTERIGTASQFVDVPDISKETLTLSGIALSGYDPREVKRSAGDAPAAGATSGMLTQAALRRFRAGQVLQFAYVIFNAKADKGRRDVQLVTQIKLYRDGREIFAGRETPYDARGQADLERLVAEGSLQLGGLQAGEYVLQAIVTDLRAKGKNRTTTNWIDFEIAR